MKTKITEKNFKRVSTLIQKSVETRFEELEWTEMKVEKEVKNGWAEVCVWNEQNDFMTASELRITLEVVSAWMVRYEGVSYTIDTKPLLRMFNNEPYFIHTPKIIIQIG
jgi:hypothetical protein